MESPGGVHGSFGTPKPPTWGIRLEDITHSQGQIILDKDGDLLTLAQNWIWVVIGTVFFN